MDLQSYEPILLAASNTSKLLRAIHAGREIRVILNTKNADDTATFQIAEAIVKRIEAEMTFSGEIKVIALRETRAEAIVRYSSQMEDGSSSTTPWTITRAEWDGHVRRTTRFMRGVMITSPLLLVLTTPLVIVLVLLRNIGGRSFSALGWTDLIPSPLGALFNYGVFRAYVVADDSWRSSSTKRAIDRVARVGVRRLRVSNMHDRMCAPNF